MSERAEHGSRLSSEAQSRLESAVARFEDGWQAGTTPSIHDYLPAAGPEREALLAELVHADLEWRLKGRQSVRVESYLKGFPELAGNPAAVLDLIRAEYRFRLRTEPGLKLEEYLTRFPGYRAELQDLFGRHGRAGAGASTLEPTDRGQPNPGSDMPAAVESPAAPTPGRGTRYLARSLHARGGLGEVFVARDVELRRDVALKRIQDRHAGDSESRRRFLLEAEVTGQLEHPGVVPVYGLVEGPDGRPSYAMRFVNGESLQEAIRRFHAAGGPGGDPGRRRRELRELLGRFLAVCNTVAYAHSRGILHRDLKPANVLLGKYGETLVVDWGLAKPFDRDRAGVDEDTLTPTTGQGEEGTQLGQAVGTPAFMSPEQAAGRWDAVGPASDVYSLGATLYALLTGEAPFRGGVREVLDKVQRGEFPPPRQLNRAAPAALQAVCLKAMALRPEDRYAGPLALAADLDRWLADEPVAAYREPVRERLRRWARRHRAAVTAGVALLLTAVAALALGVVLLSREQAETEGQRRQAQEAARRATDQRNLAVKTLKTSLLLHIEMAERGAPRAFMAFAEPFEVFRELDNSGRPARAEYQGALAITETLRTTDPERAGAYRDLSQCLRQLRDLCTPGKRPDRNRLKATQEFFRQTTRLRQLFVGASLVDLATRRQLADSYEMLLLSLFASLNMGTAKPGSWSPFDPQRDSAYREAAGEAIKQRQALILADSGDAQSVRILARRLEEAARKEQAAYHIREAREYLVQCLEARRQLARFGDKAAETRQQQKLREELVRRQLAECDAILRAVDDIDFALAQPEQTALSLLEVRVILLARAGRHADASATTDRLIQLSPKGNPVRRFNLACCHALCAFAVTQGKDPNGLTQEQKVLFDRHGDQAVRLLAGMAKDGLLDYSSWLSLRLAVDPLLNAVRHRDDFKAVAREADRQSNGVAGYLNSLRGQPKEVVTRLLGEFAVSMARAGLHPRASEAAEKLLELNAKDPGHVYRVASVYARCVAAAGAGEAVTKLTAEEERAAREQYAARAGLLLAQLRQTGYFRAGPARARLRDDPALQPLRDRDDFRAILRQIEKDSPDP